MEEWTLQLVLHHIQELNIVPLSTSQFIILGFTRYRQDKHGDINRNLKRKMKHNTEPLRQLVTHEEEDSIVQRIRFLAYPRRLLWRTLPCHLGSLPLLEAQVGGCFIKWRRWKSTLNATRRYFVLP